jgi:poly-gamma-glutamate capsule biosynthesis protein CapA/YwtB (metallophosphatase superfamily)
VLARARLGLVSTANNHAWDYGFRALCETLSHLDRVGIAHTGASVEPEQMYRPAELRVKGWSVALFAVTQIWNQGSIRTHRGRAHVAWADIERLREPIVRARREHDVVLVSYHGGGEYMREPVRWTRRFVEGVMALGVDAVLGHHPHVPQGVGWIAGRPVFYSLGNLVFDPNEHHWTSAGLMARLTFRRGQPLAVEVCPFRFNGYEPTALGRPEDQPRIGAVRRHLEAISRGVGGGELGEPGEHGCMALRPPARAEPAVAAVPRVPTSKAPANGYDGAKRATRIGDSRTP